MLPPKDLLRADRRGWKHDRFVCKRRLYAIAVVPIENCTMQQQGPHSRGKEWVELIFLEYAYWDEMIARKIPGKRLHQCTE